MAARASEEQYVGRERVGWSVEEDKKLFEYMERHGRDHQTSGIRWNDVSKDAGLMDRSGKACRLRWKDNLRPDIKKGPFTRDEVATIMELQKQHGNNWAKIAKQLPGRTQTGIKNFWNTRVKKMKKISKKETPGGRGSRGVVIVVTDAYLHQLLGKIGKLQTDDAGFTPDISPPAPPQYGHVSNKSSGSVPFVAPVSNSPEEAEASKAKANEAAGQSTSEMLLPAIANPNNNSMPSIAPEEWIDEIEKLMDILGNDDSIMELLASPLHHPHPQTPPCTFIGSRPVSTFVNVQEIDQAAVEIFDMINQPPEQEIANPNLPSEAWVDECLKDNEAFEERHASIIPSPPPPHYLAVSTPCRHGMGMAMVDHHQAGQTFSTNIRQPKLHSDVGGFPLNNTPPKQLTSPSTSFYDGWTELLMDNEVFRGDYYSLEELLSDPPL